MEAQSDREWLLIQQQLLEQIRQDVADIKKALPDLEQRIARLETFRTVVLALAGVFWPLSLLGANTLLRFVWH